MSVYSISLLLFLLMSRWDCRNDSAQNLQQIVFFTLEMVDKYKKKTCLNETLQRTLSLKCGSSWAVVIGFFWNADTYWWPPRVDWLCPRRWRPSPPLDWRRSARCSPEGDTRAAQAFEDAIILGRGVGGGVSIHRLITTEVIIYLTDSTASCYLSYLRFFHLCMPSSCRNYRCIVMQAFQMIYSYLLKHGEEVHFFSGR